MTRDKLTKHWTDWVDYWAVDFDYESRKEIINVPRSLRTGEAPCPAGSRQMNSSTSMTVGRRVHFRERVAELPHPQGPRPGIDHRRHTYPKPGRYIVAVKVIDIFGNDTMTLVPVAVG